MNNQRPSASRRPRRRPASEAIAALDWTALATALHGPRRGARAGISDAALREYFGAGELERLRALAEHARLRAGEAKLGNVVLLPGIMGSNLSTIDRRGRSDLVWVRFVRLVLGAVGRLKLADDGRDDAALGFAVQATGVDHRTYAGVLLYLAARWNVVPFPFDWRKDIGVAADGLAQFIRDTFHSQPVHLLAHSMGGLVARAFIRRHRPMWDAMRGDDGASGGRLVMLGTPNYGSFAAVHALSGGERLVRLLACADLSHSLRQLLEILATFPGSYQLLPAPGRIAAAEQAIYRAETWRDLPISARHLRRAFEFYGELEHGDSVDPARMTYIAGCARETLDGLAITASGEFEFRTTLNGDGRVTHALGRLDGVPTYYVDEAHGDLPRDATVHAAIDELLTTGATTVLATQPIPARGLPRAGAWRRPPEEAALRAALLSVAHRTKRGVASDAEQRAAELLLLRAAMGQGEPSEAPRVAAAAAAPPAQRRRLQVDLVHGDIATVAAPVAVVGHYKGVRPVRAEGAVDRALGGWIAAAEAAGMLGANLGEVFLIPKMRHRLRADAALLAGMGDPGQFGREDLRFLMTNVGLAIASLGATRFATVLVGSGAGNLPRDQAVRMLLAGLCDALQRFAAPPPLTRVMLVDTDFDAIAEMHDVLAELVRSDAIRGLELRVGRLPKRRRLPVERAPRNAPPEIERRITVERDGNRFRYAALTMSAVVPAREVTVQSFFADGAAEHLMRAETAEDQERYGRLLTTYLLPEDFQSVIDNGPLTLILDHSSASFPWEMASIRSAGGSRVFGTDLRMTRQFRTMLSRAPGVAPPTDRRLRVLLVADPAPERELQLAGARREGRAVARVLDTFKDRLDLHVVERIGAAECDPVELLALILDGEFDVIHFAGHGVFDQERPERSGWVFGGDRLLSPREIFRARRVPRLVFANACFSAVMQQRPVRAATEMNRKLAGLAEAFFERGVQNYLGSGWPVADDLAVQFASTFYEECLNGNTLADSLATARERILHQGTTWGTYQLYGQAAARLTEPPSTGASRRRARQR